MLCGGLSPGIVDHQIHAAVLTVLAGVAVDVLALFQLDAGSVDGAAHQLIPQLHGKIVGMGVKTAVLQEAVVRGCQGVVEDNTVIAHVEHIDIANGAGTDKLTLGIVLLQPCAEQVLVTGMVCSGIALGQTGQSDQVGLIGEFRSGNGNTDRDEKGKEITLDKSANHVDSSRVTSCSC